VQVGQIDLDRGRVVADRANSQFGYAATESIVFMAIVALVTFLQRRAVKLTQPGM
jgi:raffinose/stachyose/melibiose transport system permease protein